MPMVRPVRTDGDCKSEKCGRDHRPCLVREALLALARKAGGERRDGGEEWERMSQASSTDTVGGGVRKVVSPFQNVVFPMFAAAYAPCFYACVVCKQPRAVNTRCPPRD